MSIQKFQIHINLKKQQSFHLDSSTNEPQTYNKNQGFFPGDKEREGLTLISVFVEGTTPAC
jgi:hypothetical protein